jgi:cellulose synthase/poly-beta-1,6-N-acetylglucosamine synthase-like glycosyltransferase
VNGISKKRPLSKILTIVIPAYKAETTINNTLESLNYQLGNYFDVLIVDDGNPNPLLPYIQP